MFFTTLALVSIPLAVLAAPTSDVTLYAEASAVVGNGIAAQVTFTGYTDGRPTVVSFTGSQGLIDSANSPYLWHVHTNPITPDGDCDSALGHLDPLNVTESLTCDPAFSQYCQEGDMSGKHGTINGTASGAITTFSLTDDYLRWFPQDFSLLGRSIVIHSANKTRLACGNITSILDGTADASGNPTFQPSTYTTNYPTEPPFNPAVVATPFVGTTAPTKAQLLSMTFPLPNPAIPVSEDTLFVAVTQVEQTVFFNNEEQTVELFAEEVAVAFEISF